MNIKQMIMEYETFVEIIEERYEDGTIDTRTYITQMADCLENIISLSQGVNHITIDIEEKLNELYEFALSNTNCDYEICKKVLNSFDSLHFNLNFNND